MTRVLHVAETVIGGIASHLAEILPLQIREFGPDAITLVAPRDAQQHIGEIAGLRTVCFDHPGSRLRATFLLHRLLRDETRRFAPDLIHAHSSFAGIAARTQRAVRHAPPVVYCPHGWSFAQDVGTMKRRAYAAIERMLLLRTARVVNVSQHEYDLAVSNGLPSRKLAVVRNGIARAVPDHPGLATQPQIVLAPGPLNLLFVGRLDRQKGIDLLLSAVESLADRNVHFHIVGAPVREGDVNLPTHLPNLTAYGWRPRSFVFRLLQKVDALVMPSRWEGLPIIGLEALRAGIPIIGSNKTAMPELIEDGISGHLVDIDSPDALAACLASLKLDRLKSMGIAARRRFLDSFTIERQHDELLALYRNALHATATEGR